MPNIKSVVKDVKKSRQNHLRNVSAKSAMKTYIKKARTAIDAGTATVSDDVVRKALSIIDKTAQRGIIHPNAAARRKSRMMKRAAKSAAQA
ncbi:MAG: 30S ribosomal protein S20 [Armatimonadetes bacterium]|nr:30S ribosomal protein S20 [Armatimonadota bacterium]